MHQFISPDKFVERMEYHWTHKLENVTSEALRNVWKQLAQAFNENISGNISADYDRWIVVQPPTGSGKTQGAILYNAMLALEINQAEHPGSLIVTRLKEEADDIAMQINRLAGNKVAIAHHSDSNTSWEELQDYPVLVITHRAYELALDHLGQDGNVINTFSYFHRWNSLLGERHLVIIDECLDIVEESQVTLDSLKIALAVIPPELKSKFGKEYSMLQIMAETIEKQALCTENYEKKEMMVALQGLPDEQQIDMTKLRSAMKKERLDNKILRKSDSRENQRQHHFLDETLKAADIMIKTWIYFANHSGKYTWNTARLLVPDGIKGAVVLDASASTNVVYKLFNNATVWSPPEGARNYQNVTLHVSRGHKVGKTDMERAPLKVASSLLADLNGRLKKRNVLIVTHKNIEPSLLCYEPDFQMMTGHWGAIQGRNIWRDCDTIVLFGLPYKPNICSANTFMALQEPKDTEWLNNPEQRKFNEYEDIRLALKIGWLVTDIVQSFNRIRSRKVIDKEGNCPPCDGFILFQDNQEADKVLAALKREMPGINIVEDWHIESRKKRVKKSKYEEALCQLFKIMIQGRATKTDIANELGTSVSTMGRLLYKANDQESRLHKTMQDYGIQLLKEKHGRTFRHVFFKG